MMEFHIHDYGDAEYADIKAGRASCVDPECPDRFDTLRAALDAAVYAGMEEAWRRFLLDRLVASAPDEGPGWRDPRISVLAQRIDAAEERVQKGDRPGVRAAILMDWYAALERWDAARPAVPEALDVERLAQAMEYPSVSEDSETWDTMFDWHRDEDNEAKRLAAARVIAKRYVALCGQR